MVSHVGLSARTKPSWPTPPKSVVLSRSGLESRAQSYKISLNSRLAPQTVEMGFCSPSQLHSALLKTPKSTLFSFSTLIPTTLISEKRGGHTRRFHGEVDL